MTGIVPQWNQLILQWVGRWAFLFEHHHAKNIVFKRDYGNGGS
jgi:hypothetical protein